MTTHAELPALAGSRGLPISTVGPAIGKIFSWTRSLWTDPVMESAP